MSDIEDRDDDFTPDEEAGAEIEIEAAAEPAVEIEEDGGSDQFAKAETATQKRIDRLTKKMRTAEREREEAIRYAQQVQEEARALRSRMEALDNNYISEYSTRVQTQMGTAEQELARAIEIGDTKSIIDAQRKLTQLTLEDERARQAKFQQDRYSESQKQAAQQHYIQQRQQQAPKRPDPKAEMWAQKNSWFGQDEAMTYAAFGIHKKLVENEGFDPRSDDYYTELDRRMSEEFPHKLKSDGGRRAAQTVASVSRQGSGRSSGKRVRLTPSQIAISKKLGVPLEEYAKYVKE